MSQQHDWEWLRPNDRDPSTHSESLNHEIQQLRRWIEPQPTSDEQSSQPKPSRQLRRQRLKEAQQEAQETPQQPLSNLVDLQAPSLPDSPSCSPKPSPAENQADPAPPQNSVRKPMAKKKDEYREYLKQEFSQLFDNLDLQDRQRHYLKSRWLDQVLWMEGRAGKARDMHYRLRLTTIIGGVLVPALVSLNFTGNDNQYLKQTVSISTFMLSQIVAVCAATEQFFNHGERWRHYRRGVETLKTQGWQFFELTGPYQSFSTHQQAFSTFASQTEQILQHDVEVYATQVTQAKKEDNQKEEQPSRDSRKPEIAAVR